jgi:hypothetical protein
LKKRASIYRRISSILISALTGRARIGVTLVVYATVALLLLVYVSAQVYTGVLTQDISEIKQSRSSQREKLNRLTSDYVSLSSRARVSEYCETVLNMVEARDESLRRFAIDNIDRNFLVPVEFTEKGLPILDPYRFTLRDKNGKSKL